MGKNPPQTGLPGMDDDQFLRIESASPTKTRKTLRDLIDEQDAAEPAANAVDSALAEDVGTRTFTLGFPSAELLARFVAGYHAQLLESLGFGRLEVVAGGTKPSRRYYHLGKSVTPDVLLRAEDGTHVVVMVSGGMVASTRMPLVDELKVISGIMGPTIGVLVTPSALAEGTASAIWAHIAELRKHHDVHWLRYAIDLEMAID
jgi:hypothetical protein